ncbi:hypothetical protein Hdeb2414_s0106g00796161 [Helianthus debilis subsp. tardiflorus]
MGDGRCWCTCGVPGGTVSSHWIVDSGASRHMTGDLRLLYDVRNIRGGYVAFAGDKGGYITGEGKISNDFLHVQILKARRTWSMTSFGMKTRREGTQVMKLIELPLAIINTSRISLHKDKVNSRA